MDAIPQDLPRFARGARARRAPPGHGTPAAAAMAWRDVAWPCSASPSNWVASQRRGDTHAGIGNGMQKAHSPVQTMAGPLDPVRTGGAGVGRGEARRRTAPCSTKVSTWDSGCRKRVSKRFHKPAPDECGTNPYAVCWNGAGSVGIGQVGQMVQRYVQCTLQAGHPLRMPINAQDDEGEHPPHDSRQQRSSACDEPKIRHRRLRPDDDSM